MLVLPNVTMKQSIVRKKEKEKRTTKSNKKTITYDAKVTQYKNGIIKCEKKK